MKTIECKECGTCIQICDSDYHLLCFDGSDPVDVICSACRDDLNLDVDLPRDTDDSDETTVFFKMRLPKAWAAEDHELCAQLGLPSRTDLYKFGRQLAIIHSKTKR